MAHGRCQLALGFCEDDRIFSRETFERQSFRRTEESVEESEKVKAVDREKSAIDGFVTRLACFRVDGSMTSRSKAKVYHSTPTTSGTIRGGDTGARCPVEGTGGTVAIGQPGTTISASRSASEKVKSRRDRS
ncbi:hypothetical protein K0M31_004467 [Melipona bicolor]|uniref:Uncharacterized protein n=1 Tax=Melipona bicolor TaxID=60889 RepID=A0AA40KNI0_9HYME|nr:hypothetical protein K0M31_004467 [Melipona bicolor]